jgi:dTDP-4-dehydrorhamnose 3,5-epimerase
MEIQAALIPDVKIITPVRHRDRRGFFCEVYNKRALAEEEIDSQFVQDNHSYSVQRGTLRGLHFQCPPAAQNKLVRVLRGAVLDVSVDCRARSPTYGQYVMVELNAATGNQVFCPRGFAHGTLTLDHDTEIAYKVDAYYAQDLDLGIRWDDPDLAIDWPIPADQMSLSEKDRRLPWFRDLPVVFGYP